MNEEKTTRASIIANDVFVSVGTLIACFGIIAILAVGSFGAICSLIGIFRSFTADKIAVSLVLSLCGLCTAVLMFYLGVLVSKAFLDGFSEYILTRKKKVASLKNGKKD